MRTGRLGDARFVAFVSPLSARWIMIRCKSAFVCYWLLQCWRPLMVRSLWRGRFVFHLRMGVSDHSHALALRLVASGSNIARSCALGQPNGVVVNFRASISSLVVFPRVICFARISFLQRLFILIIKFTNRILTRCSGTPRLQPSSNGMSNHHPRIHSALILILIPPTLTGHPDLKSPRQWIKAFLLY